MRNIFEGVTYWSPLEMMLWKHQQHDKLLLCWEASSMIKSEMEEATSSCRFPRKKERKKERKSPPIICFVFFNHSQQNNSQEFSTIRISVNWSRQACLSNRFCNNPIAWKTKKKHKTWKRRRSFRATNNLMAAVVVHDGRLWMRNLWETMTSFASVILQWATSSSEKILCLCSSDCNCSLWTMPVLMPSLKNFLTRIMLMLLLLFPWSTTVMGVLMAMEL